MYEEDGVAMSRSVTAEVPQGSVLGLTIWNFFYDELLRVALPDEVELIAYADDIAIVAWSRLKWANCWKWWRRKWSPG